ncbi:MAG TPA: hypothetical protein VNH18_13420 [Bryobacteraceae bacterium]|nr:hypothetical protein [Bryobacteraceae bacterium]
MNHRIRKVAADGTITTIAGTGVNGFSGDGGPATAAMLKDPGGITLDAAGNLYFNDDSNYRTRRISASGTITTVAGNGVAGFGGDGGAAVAASLNGNFGVAIDPSGNLYLADSMNNRIRQVLSSPPTISSGGIVPIYSTTTSIQPGSWVSIFGNNLADATAAWNNDFPTTLANTAVTINGKSGYLWYVSPTQINLQAPDDSTTGSVDVVVTTPGGTATGEVTLSPFGPSFSLLDGKHVAGIILRSDGSGAYGGGTYDIAGPTGTSLGYKTVAAKAGDNLVLFGVGFGPTTPAVAAGRVFTGSALTVGFVKLSINNVIVVPTFSGLVAAGLYQLNIVPLPAGLGTGDVPLRATAGGILTQSGVVLTLQ